MEYNLGKDFSGIVLSDEYEENAATVKNIVLNGLVRDGLLEPEKAMEWGMKNGIVAKERNILRRIFSRKGGEEEKKGWRFSLVKIADETCVE